MIRYFEEYERRYELPIMRPVGVKAVRRFGDRFQIETSQGLFESRVVVSGTWTWSNPFVPAYPGREEFDGEQLHSANDRTSQPFIGKRVLIAGAGNSGAQILAEISEVASEVVWVT